MTIEVGDVYCDKTFDDEVIIVDQQSDKVTLDGPVNGSDLREIDLWRFEHNIRVGRYEKIGNQEVEEPEVVEKEERSVFAY
jgi:hypothetical protein